MRSASGVNHLMILLLSLAVLSGCATVPAGTAAPSTAPQKASDRQRTIALEYEKKGDIRQAAMRWEIVAKIRPEDPEAARKVPALKAQADETAETYFKRGIANYKRNKLDDARRDFLLTLNLNPEHKEALDYLKNRLVGSDTQRYQIKKGDTLKSIAQKNYGDGEKAYVIAYFNNISVNAKLNANDEISIPVLEPAMMGKQAEIAYPDESTRKGPDEFARKGSDTKGAMGEAQSFLESKEYLRAIAIAEKMLQTNPSRKDARDLLNTACYERGRSLLREEKYQGAVSMFECADPGYKDARNLAAVSKKKLADFHYIRGVEFFMYEKLDEAIEEWKMTLSIDPNHPKAAKDIENARGLLNKLKDIR